MQGRQLKNANYGVIILFILDLCPDSLFQQNKLFFNLKNKNKQKTEKSKKINEQ